MKIIAKLNPCKCGDVPTVDAGSMNHVLICSCGISMICDFEKYSVQDAVDHWNELHPLNEEICEHIEKRANESVDKFYDKLKNLADPENHTYTYTSTTEPTTPNCGICEWCLPFYKHEIRTERCTAQGYKTCEEAYNTDECQKLYKPEEVE